LCAPCGDCSQPADISPLQENGRGLARLGLRARLAGWRDTTWPSAKWKSIGRNACIVNARPRLGRVSARVSLGSCHSGCRPAFLIGSARPGKIPDPTQDEVANRGGQRHERTIEARLDACRAVYVRRDRHGVDRHVLVVPDGLVSLQNASIPQAP